MQTLVKEGKQGFYKGRIAEAIVEVVQKNGGVLSTKDLANHSTAYVVPINTEFKGVKVWEIPPNGQGLIALLALNILEGYDLKGIYYCQRVCRGRVRCYQNPNPSFDTYDTFQEEARITV